LIYFNYTFAIIRFTGEHDKLLMIPQNRGDLNPYNKQIPYKKRVRVIKSNALD